MHIKSVEFAGAIGQVDQAAPESVLGLPHVAFSGRSNVGKSSLINRLLGRTRSPIARVSSTPGKTQEINFYHVRTDVGDFALVDLPGYGYARAPEAAREKWRLVIEAYLTRHEDLKGVVQLIDMRHPPTQDDLRSVEFLAELELPVLFALTKADKVKASKRDQAIKEIVLPLGVGKDQVVPVSATKGEGIDELLDTLEQVIG